jgi:hypothetical protein
VTDDRPDSPPLDQPPARARLPQAPCPSHDRIEIARAADRDHRPKLTELDWANPRR